MTRKKKPAARRNHYCDMCNSEHAGACPTPDEIRERASEIRNAWTPKQAYARHYGRCEQVVLVEVTMNELAGGRVFYDSSFND